MPDLILTANLLPHVALSNTMPQLVQKVNDIIDALGHLSNVAVIFPAGFGTVSSNGTQLVATTANSVLSLEAGSNIILAVNTSVSSVTFYVLAANSSVNGVVTTLAGQQFSGRKVFSRRAHRKCQCPHFQRTSWCRCRGRRECRGPIRRTNISTLISQVAGASVDVDWNDGNEQYVVLTANCVITTSNPVNGGRYCILVNSGPGNNTLTWPATWLWNDGTSPEQTLTANTIDLYTGTYIASIDKYIGAFNQNYIL